MGEKGRNWRRMKGRGSKGGGRRCMGRIRVEEEGGGEGRGEGWRRGRR